MAKIDEWDAEAAIMELADRLPEECEAMIATMVECKATAPSSWIERHQEWREDKGVPHFRATIQYRNEMGLRVIGGDRIRVKVEGTFKESSNGLNVSRYSVEECCVVDNCEE